MRYKKPSYMPGDIIVFSGRGPISALVKLATCSPHSHVGIVARVSRATLLLGPFMGTAGRHWAADEQLLRDWQTRLLLFESTTLSDAPCEITGEKINGVQAHDPASLVEGFKGRVYRMRLQPAWHRKLGSVGAKRLAGELLSHIGTSYDIPGSVLSATRILKRLCPSRAADRSEMVCVEYVASALLRVLDMSGSPLRLRLKPGQMTPGQFVRRLHGSGVYTREVRIK